MKYYKPILIILLILIVILLSLYWCKKYNYELFSPVDDDVKKIITFVSSSVSMTYDTYTTFLKGNKITSTQYYDNDVFVGLVILKKLGLLNSANIVKLMS